MKTSCGIIPFRKNENGEVEFFLGHTGGYYPSARNPWMFLKGSVEGDEEWVETAMREFKEETGLPMEDVDESALMPLGMVRQNPHKVVVAFGLHYPDINPDTCHSNMVDGVTPEIDKYRWMTYDEVCECTHHAHIAFYDRIIEMIG